MIIIVILFTIINHKITKGAIMDTQERKEMRACDFLCNLFVDRDKVMDLETSWQTYELVYNDKLTEEEFKGVYNNVVFVFELLSTKLKGDKNE